MKQLSLQQAMLGMRIVLTNAGMLIKSPAGYAEYDLKGRRTKVNGYPEYFPGQLRVKDKRTLNKGYVVQTPDGGYESYSADGTLRMRIGRLHTNDDKEKASPAPAPDSENDVPGKLRDIIQRIGSSDAFNDLVPNQCNEGVVNNHYHIKIAADANGKQYAAGMGVGVEGDKKQVQFLADRFAVRDGQVFINDAFLKAAAVTPAALADKAGEETGDTPTRTRTMRIAYASNRQRVEDIVGDYLTGEASELRGEMVEELMTLIGEPAATDIIANAQATASQMARQDAATISVQNIIAKTNETIREVIRKELRPGGLIWSGLRHR